MRQTVLIVDDDRSLLEALKKLLKPEGISVVCAQSPSEALSLYAREKMNFDLVIIDYHFQSSDVTGSDLALRVRQQNPHQSVIFMTGREELEAVDSMFRTGIGRTFIRKGGGPDTILLPILQVLKEIRPSDAPLDSLEDEINRSSEINALGLIGRSKELYEIVKTVEQVRRFRSRFLIIGESGAGKELIAKAFAIKGRPFYAVDCSGFSANGEQFLESQLFGRKKGAYTGADSDLKGVLEIANGGVVFLDELHCLSLGSQSKLLRALQENKFRRLGDASGPEMSFDVTLVAATQPLIFGMMESGQFKKDLYARVAKMEIVVPPLSARPADIRPLAEYFIKVYSKRHGLIRDAHPQLLRELESYSWPKNVRELENFVDQLIMTSKTDVLGPEFFRQYVAGKLNLASEKIEAVIHLDQVVSSVESEQIIRTLELSLTVSEAAARMQIARTTLNDRMKKLTIDPRKYLKRAFQAPPDSAQFKKTVIAN